MLCSINVAVAMQSLTGFDACSKAEIVMKTEMFALYFNGFA